MSPDARRAAHAVLRRLPQLRDQLQPRQGPGAAVHRVARRATDALRVRRWPALLSRVSLAELRPPVCRSGPATPESEARSRPVIDSHCHLADETFAADLDRRSIARAKAAGARARAGDSRRPATPQEAAQARASRRSGRRRASSIGVHPHAAHEFAADPDRAAAVVRDAARRDAVGARDRRDRPRLPLRLLAARRAAAGLPRAGPAGARAAAAGRHPHARGRRRHARDPARGGRRGRCAACCTASPATPALARAGARPRASTSRSPASSRFRRPASCARRPGSCRSIGC